MDDSTSAAQDVQKQQASDQQAHQQPSGQSQSTQSMPIATQHKAPTMISVGGGESGPSMMVQENPGDDEDDEDELAASQETKNLGMMGQGEEEEAEQQIISPASGVGVEEEAIELQPSVPEIATSNAEVEKVIERSPDQEKPDIPKEVVAAGVTHSGPGIIDMSQMHFKTAKPPVPFAVAVKEEHETKLHDSKHWLMGMIMYIWRRLDPNIGKKKKDEVSIVQPGEVPMVVEAVEARRLDDRNG